MSRIGSTKLGQGMTAEEAVEDLPEGPGAEALSEPLRGRLGFRLRVPATSANLGPGYDCMGLALGWEDVIDVVASPRADPGAARVEVQVSGQGADSLPRDASHLVVSLIEKILNARGYWLPDLTVQAQNSIPHSRGLGSSAAAVATAVVTASELLPEGLSEDEQLQLGSRIEGHPDNYVPALRGGVAVSWEAEERFATAPLTPHPQLRTVLAVPGFEQSTEAARGLLPAQVPHAQAAANSARAALLVHALSADPDLLMEATRDSLHQEYRRSAFPESMQLVDRLRAAGHPAVISGAGPSVLVLTATDERAEQAAAAIRAEAGEAWTPMILPISGTGATVEAHQR